MLRSDELNTAVDLQQRSYRLLRWVARNVDDAEMAFTAAHDGIADEAAALQWIEANWRQMPADTIPQHSAFVPFANLLASYLTTSFDLAEEPGVRQDRNGRGCWCDLCTRLVAASHLRPKKVLPADKRRARALKFDHVAELAAELGKRLDDAVIDALIDSDELGRSIAMATWGEHLIRRMRGDNDGPGVLALWREFAWKREGSPDPDFEVDARTLFEAELALATRIDPSVRRVTRIDDAIAAPAGLTVTVLVPLSPHALEQLSARGLGPGAWVDLRRPDGTMRRERIAGFTLGSGTVELGFANGLTPADLPSGTEIWLPES